MRKMNFLTVIFALFISVGAFAQDLTASSVTCIPATTITCTDDPLHPFAGREYEYSVSVTPPEGDYTWFVTTDTDILTSTGITTNIEDVASSTIIASASSNYNTATPHTTPDANKVNITWKHTTTNPVLLVMYVKGDGTTTCSDNLKVYKIEPKNAFALEIANLDPNTGDGSGPLANESCVSDVASAKFNAATNNMVYNYGENYLYFIVNAANFNTSWTPSFQVDGLQGNQVAEVHYAKADALNNWLSTNETSGTFVGGTAVTPQTGTSVGKAGECIVVRVKVTHDTYELTSNQDITLKVDGTTADGQDDVMADCTVESAMADASKQTIKQRPTITSNTAGGNFIQP